MPWSPAPIRLFSSVSPFLASWDSLTPMAMSGDWESMEVSTPQVLPSKPHSGLS